LVYKIKYTPGACKQLSKLDKPTALRIVEYMEDKAVNPTETGKSLRQNLKGYWRHRVGDYRVISSIEDEALVVLVVMVGHRKKIYQNMKK